MELQINKKPTLIHEKDTFKLFLQDKGINEQDLISPIGKAIASYNEKTTNYPAGYRGYTITAETIVGLREILKPKGFIKHSPSNIELTVNEDTKFAIHVIRGDEQTGQITGYPSSLRKKGDRTLEYFGLATSETNQLDMFQNDLPYRDSSRCQYDIWFLMLYVLKEADTGITIRAELSKPIFCSQKGFVNGFSKRYQIDVNDLNNTLLINPSENPDDGYSDDLDLDILLIS